MTEEVVPNLIDLKLTFVGDSNVGKSCLISV